jgi:hypothetical protein
MGGDCALVSDAARAWLEIKDHYDSLNNKSVDRISSSGFLAADVGDIKHHAMKRIDSGITGAHYLALLLDPRPSMRAFVKQRKLAGDAEAKSLGNTAALHAAKEALRTMAPALEAGRKKQSDAEVVEAVYNALLIYLEVSVFFFFFALEATLPICSQL